MSIRRKERVQFFTGPDMQNLQQVNWYVVETRFQVLQLNWTTSYVLQYKK